MSAWDLIGTVLISGAFSGSITWLIREWISTRLKESIRNEYETKRIQFEADLRREADASLERLRSELSIEAARRTVEHTRIHERRLELISELGGKLYNLRAAFVDYASPVKGIDQPDMKTARDLVGKAIREFDASLQPRRCFIPAGTLGKLEAFKEEVLDITWKFMAHVEFIDDGRATPQFVKTKHETWDAARAFVLERSKELLVDLHRDFQSILGIAVPTARGPAPLAEGDSAVG